ncbi:MULTISPECIES: hypothetical protein [unclassified Moorena]|uniref:hypothetical protein n=1 Tax=unclassified Moorena TaxID=2683338 RepID=UPI0014006269|nr:MULTISPECIES: hypothetical protein [unclassified Moorena]NEO12169.1 hypothetical protein [Moorena sp. SIO3E8]NEQ00917.1 hypothetical protein [Moorena sp. SIO3F7]
MINQETLQQVEQKLIDRYSQRLEKFGCDPRTLGWDSLQSQDLRFATACDSLKFKHKSVLDVRCGLADFYDYMIHQAQLSLSSYTGFDINPDLIRQCQHKFPSCNFSVVNILLDKPSSANWDIVT